MNSYIESLRRHVEQEQAKQQKAISLQTLHPPVKPLEQQLIEYFRSLSPAQICRAWTMNEIIRSGNLTGKYRDRPHPQQIAEILTRNAWTKRRLYGAEFGGKKYWFPPV